MNMSLGQAVDILHSYGITTEDRHACIMLSALVIQNQEMALKNLRDELAHADKALAQYEDHSSIPLLGEVGDGCVVDWYPDAIAVSSTSRAG